MLKKSFTLVETIVAIFVFSLALGAICALVVLGYRTYSYTLQQSVAINEARKGVETMVREVREAKPGEDGSYPIEKADDKEFIFYSDIDKDGHVEKVRYFLGTAGSGTLTKKCFSSENGGSCSVNFSNFLSGNLTSAKVKVSVEGDLGWSIEYAHVYADGDYLGKVCESGCSDCAGSWQGTETFEVTSQAKDNSIQFTADASPSVNNFCDWQEQNHSLKAKFEFSWTEEIAGHEHEFKKGVINPAGDPPTYPLDQEQISILSSYVRNVPPIFRYFDEKGEELIETPARLKDTKVMEFYLVINVNPKRVPKDFELRSAVQLRNLKIE